MIRNIHVDIRIRLNILNEKSMQSYYQNKINITALYD